MARDSLTGLWIWTRDFSEENDIFTVVTESGHCCLWDRPLPCRLHPTTIVDEEEELIGPKVIVEWSKE